MHILTNSVGMARIGDFPDGVHAATSPSLPAVHHNTCVTVDQVVDELSLHVSHLMLAIRFCFGGGRYIHTSIHIYARPRQLKREQFLFPTLHPSIYLYLYVASCVPHCRSSPRRRQHA